MKILIDGQEGLISHSDSFNPKTLLDTIEATLHSSGKTIASASFNGSVIENSENFFDDTTPTSDDILSVECGSLKDHFIQLFNSVELSLDDAEEKAISIADRFLNVDNNEALGELSSWSSDVYGLIENIIQFIKIFNVDTTPITIGNAPFITVLEEITGFCSDVNRAIENDDRSNVSDLLEFDIASRITSLKETFPHFKARINEVL